MEVSSQQCRSECVWKSYQGALEPKFPSEESPISAPSSTGLPCIPDGAQPLVDTGLRTNAVIDFSAQQLGLSQLHPVVRDLSCMFMSTQLGFEVLMLRDLGRLQSPLVFPGPPDH